MPRTGREVADKRRRDSRRPQARESVGRSRLGVAYVTAAATAQGLRHAKFTASSTLPFPKYLATCGYGHNGRVRITWP